jgi:hypothetical protein
MRADATEDATEVTPLVNGSATRLVVEPAVKRPLHRRIVEGIVTEAREILRLVVGRPQYQLILLGVLLLGFAGSITGVLVLYLSARYNQKFATVGVTGVTLFSLSSFSRS